MELDKNLQLHIPSVPGFEKVAMDFAASVAKVMKFPEARIEDWKTAIAEACINAIEHGNKLDASSKVGLASRSRTPNCRWRCRTRAPGLGRGRPPVSSRSWRASRRPEAGAF